MQLLQRFFTILVTPKKREEFLLTFWIHKNIIHQDIFDEMTVFREPHFHNVFSITDTNILLLVYNHFSSIP